MTRIDKATDEGADIDPLFRSLTVGALKVFENAVELESEAKLLHAAGALSRALFLHQISLEECAKIDMIGAWATARLLGENVDPAKLARSFASHKAKNYTNAYMLPASSQEDAARSAKRWEDAQRAFKERQNAFHQDSNTAKNASLYVDMKGETFLAPREQITTDMVEAIAATNQTFLGHAAAKVRMLQAWLDKPWLAQRLLEHFRARFSELRSSSGDVDEMLSSLMDDLFTRARETGYADHVVDGER
jgi:AbiV family abortive infection protein